MQNPFTPVFGGKPSFFFGRSSIILGFCRALVDPGSEDRALFLTGTRGSGKTALVEQLSLEAHHRGWRTIDLGPENVVHALARRLAGYDEQTTTVDPQLSVSILGSGASVGGISTARTNRVDESDLDLLLIEACKRESKGIVLTLDEVQKLSERDISTISNAFQMASRKGCEAVLVVAGLPYAHSEITAFEGCTFMRRASHIQLGLLLPEEVREAFGVGIPESLLPDEEGLDALVSASYGHPYMVQLLGYYYVALHADDVNLGDSHMRQQGVDKAIEMAQNAFRSRALRPMVDELSPLEKQFLASIAEALSEDRVALVADAASNMGRKTKQVSAVRDKLIRLGLIVAPEHGKLMFAVPYLADYLLEPSDEEDGLRLIREWGV